MPQKHREEPLASPKVINSSRSGDKAIPLLRFPLKPPPQYPVSSGRERVSISAVVGQSDSSVCRAYDTDCM